MQSITETAPVVVPVLAEHVARYLRGGLTWWFVTEAWSLAVPALILWTGLSARIQRRVTERDRPWFFVVTACGAVYSTLTFVAEWPLSYYVEFARPHHYGMAQTSIADWQGRSLREGIATVVIVSLSVWSCIC